MKATANELSAPLGPNRLQQNIKIPPQNLIFFPLFNFPLHLFARSFCSRCRFANYSLAFYFGSTLVENQTRNQLFKRTYTVGDVITIFFGITMGGFSLGQASPCLKSFAQGKEAGYQVLQVIDRKPLIADNPNGKTIPHISGHIKFNNVHFTYPSKPDITVLNSINIDIQPMKKTAFVGESGSGKSTIIQLIERFYDPVSGSVEIDGVNIKDLSLTWLRQNIGYVG